MNMTEKAQIVLTDSGKEIYKTPNFGEPRRRRQANVASAIAISHAIVATEGA